MKSQIVFSGDLEYLNLGELIQIIGSNGSTGVLRIISKYIERPGQIYFREGNPVEAEAGSKRGLEAIYSLFGWTEGEFEFSNESVAVKDSIKKSRMEIILEGLRLLDDNEIEVKGAVTFESGNKNGSAKGLPVIKGPLIDYMDIVAEEEYSAGQPIVHQGRYGTWMWVVLEGEVEICVELGGKTFKLLKIGAGSFIGSISSFEVQNDVRSATVIASDRVQLGVLDRQRLAQEYSSFSVNFKNLMLSLDKRMQQLNRLVLAGRQGKRLKSPPVDRTKSPIIRQGDKQNRLFSITSGSAYVVKERSENDLVLGQLKKNDFIGKLPFMNIGHEPGSAAVYGSDDLQTKPMDVDQLMEEYERMSGTMMNMIENRANFIVATTKLAMQYNKKQKK
ncbi:MAG: cyclic nucleotide-binding domain-containing protein, partial [Desulfosudaceae bacterium]